MSLGEEILALDDSERRAVEVPQWGKTLYVRAFSARARDAWETDNMARREGGDKAKFTENFRARLVALTVVDEAGKPVWTLEQAEALGEKSSKALSLLFVAACELNGLTAPEVETHVKK